MKYLQIPTEFLIEIITQSRPTHLFGISLRSRMPNIPDFNPSVVRYEIGILLQESDPEEERVKVFLFPESRHAEVWLRGEWDQSNTRYYKAQQDSMEHQQKLHKIQISKDKISDFVFEKMNVPKDQAAHKKLVDVLYELTFLPEALDVIPGLKTLLQEHGNLKKDPSK